ncbi:MAG: uroporphyrinogen-III C-methyltransferase [Amphritea sp.]
MKKNGNNSQDNPKKTGDVIEGEVIAKENIPVGEVSAAKESAAKSQSSAKTQSSAKKTAAAKDKPAAKQASSQTKQSDAPAKPVKDEQPRKPSSWPGALALLLALIALAGVGYTYWLQMQTSQQLAAAQQQSSNVVATAIDASKQQLNKQLNQQIGTVNQQMSALQQQADTEKANINELQERLTRSIQQVTAQQQNTSKDWLLAEVEYLLRLANQRVLMEQTPQGALKLLRSADKILSETDDVTIYEIRKALAADIAALEAVPELDTEGVFLRLGALNSQVDRLQVIPLTEQHKLPEIVEEVTSDSFSESLTADIKAAWAKVSSKFEQLIIVQHRDEPIEPLLSPQQSYYLQQNLHLMLEQAQLSLLQRKPRSYSDSLDKAKNWIGTYFEQNDSGTQALLKALGELTTIEVAPQMPDISSSLTSLKTYLKQMRRLKEKGAE